MIRFVTLLLAFGLVACTYPYATPRYEGGYAEPRRTSSICEMLDRQIAKQINTLSDIQTAMSMSATGNISYGEAINRAQAQRSQSIAQLTQAKRLNGCPP